MCNADKLFHQQYNLFKSNKVNAKFWKYVCYLGVFFDMDSNRFLSMLTEYVLCSFSIPFHGKASKWSSCIQLEMSPIFIKLVFDRGKLIISNGMKSQADSRSLPSTIVIETFCGAKVSLKCFFRPIRSHRYDPCIVDWNKFLASAFIHFSWFWRIKRGRESGRENSSRNNLTFRVEPMTTWTLTLSTMLTQHSILVAQNRCSLPVSK